MAPLSSPGPPYRKGQEVLRCEPFAYVVNTEYLNAVCDYCLRNTIKEENEGIKNTSDLDKCPKCEVVYYCNSICQKKAWDAYHLQECAYIRKLHPKYYKGYWFKNKNFAYSSQRPTVGAVAAMCWGLARKSILGAATCLLKVSSISKPFFFFEKGRDKG